MNEYIPIISSVTALLAVIIGPFITLYIAKRQIKANVLSPNRQNWIHILRDEISNYLAITARTGSATASRTEDQSYIMCCIEDLSRSESKIRLLLNPIEPDHQDLISLLKKTSSSVWYLHANNKGNFAEDLNTLREDIIKIAQPILKKEWVRVKKLE